VRDRQLELVRDDWLPHRPLEKTDLPRRLVRHPEGAYLAGGLELVECSRNLVRLDEGIRAVQQQDVDVVGLQGAQGPVDRADQMFIREVEVRSLLHDAGLGLDGDLLAFGGAELHRVGEAPLAAMQLGPVHIGVIEEVDAGVARRSDQLAHGLIIKLRDPHEPEHDVRHTFLGRAERDCLHDCSLINGMPHGWSRSTVQRRVDLRSPSTCRRDRRGDRALTDQAMLNGISRVWPGPQRSTVEPAQTRSPAPKSDGTQPIQPPSLP
jgi:hypothetical protein